MHHHLATEVLEASNKENAKLRQRAEAQVEDIDSLKAEVKVAREMAMQRFIDHFEEHSLYDTFANFWASWNAQTMLGRLREVYHPTLDISALEIKFGRPTRGRPDIQLLRRLWRVPRKLGRCGGCDHSASRLGL